MPKRKVFYSFHYNNDVFRVQHIRNMGILEGNSPTTPNEWEVIKQSGDAAIKRWINANLQFKSCVIVLIGSETADRKWVKYEIEQAWNERKGLLGIYIHNLNCPKRGTCKQGKNPFSNFTVNGIPLSNIVKTYNPSSSNAYNEIKDNIEIWIEEAIVIRQGY